MQGPCVHTSEIQFFPWEYKLQISVNNVRYKQTKLTVPLKNPKSLWTYVYPLVFPKQGADSHYQICRRFIQGVIVTISHSFNLSTTEFSNPSNRAFASLPLKHMITRSDHCWGQLGIHSGGKAEQLLSATVSKLCQKETRSILKKPRIKLRDQEHRSSAASTQTLRAHSVHQTGRKQTHQQKENCFLAA